MGEYIRGGIERLKEDYPEIGDIRQIGLHIGIEFIRNPKTKEPLVDETISIRKEGFNNGIIFGLSSVRKNVLKIKPPLIVNQNEADEILALLKKCLKKVLRKEL